MRAPRGEEGASLDMVLRFPQSESERMCYWTACDYNCCPSVLIRVNALMPHGNSP